MSSIHDLLTKAEAQSFVGRHTELKLMEEQLTSGRMQWNLLHFHGINGIGKTTLLKRFANSSTSPNFIYLNTDIIFQSPQQFLHQLTQIIDERTPQSIDSSIHLANTPTTTDVIVRLNTLALEKPPFLLLFDSLELWRPIINWLFESFIPKLSADIRLFSAGQEPLEGKWKSSSPWSLLVKNIPLQPLTKPYVREYFQSVGMSDPVLQKRIVALSNGYPFAMHLCCQMVNDGEPFEVATLKQTIKVLRQTILDNLQISSNEHALIEAASVVGRFDKELLMHITERTMNYEEFDQFCDLPIVSKGKDGWNLLDGIRNWIQTDFKEHSPDLFTYYKKRALEMLQRRWTSATPLKRRSLFLENIYAVENELLQEYYFLGDETIYDIRTAREEDLPIIQDIWKYRHLNKLQSVNDGTEQEKLFHAIWKLESDAFKAFWKDDCIVGFASIVSFTKEARDIFRQNELYHNYLHHTKPAENERLFWVGGTAEKNDYETLNVIFRYFFEQLMDECLYSVLFPTDYDISGLLSLGFLELPWAASASPSGKRFRMLQLDVREISLLRLLTTSYPGNSRTSINHVVAIQWTKKILMSFHDFESDRALFEQTIAILEIEGASKNQAIRAHIRTAIEEVAKRTDKDRVMMRALQLTYIDCIGPNEIVAERLHLSISTFYRYIKNGIEKLALQLVNTSESL